jgi:hypothetical protein
MWLGRVAIGDWVTITVQCETTSPVAPTAAPTLSIYNASDTVVVDAVKMGPWLAGVATGVFSRRVRITSAFSAGRHTVRITWASGGNNYAALQSFEVTAGDAAGAVVSLCDYPRPQRRYAVSVQDDGTLRARVNPREA